jgi:putative ABC transport system permease protein
MSVLSQIVAVSAMNLRNLPQRAGASIVVIVGIGGVVAVLLSVMSLASGLRHTLATTGHAERVIALSNSAQSEESSNLSREVVRTLSNLPGIQHTAAGPRISADVIASIWLPKPHNSGQASVALRGVSAGSFAVRPEIRVSSGRAFRAGMSEVMVGRAAAARFPALRVGNYVTASGTRWLIVGQFASGGDAHESELMADADMVRSVYHRNTYNSVTMWLESPAALTRVKDAVSTDPTLFVDVMLETEFYAQQTQHLGRFLILVANVIAGVMALGAVFAALNTMYGAVGARTIEIATLRALGFGRTAVVASVFAEILALALCGALAGAAAAWLVLGGKTVSTVVGSGGMAQVAFELRIDFDLVLIGIVWACVVGLIGAIPPAWRAVRLPVTAALRGT